MPRAATVRSRPVISRFIPGCETHRNTHSGTEPGLLQKHSSPPMLRREPHLRLSCSSPTSQPEQHPLTYHWDFSDGAGNLPENSQKNPLWRFWEDDAPSFTVTLTVTNAYGSDTITKQNYITFGDAPSPAPVAAFTSAVRSGTAPLTVQFTDRSTGAPQTYAWDFTNDKTIDSTAKSPSFTYATAGTYTVNLTVTNANGKDSEIKTGYIRVSAPGTNPYHQPRHRHQP